MTRRAQPVPSQPKFELWSWATENGASAQNKKTAKSRKEANMHMVPSSGLVRLRDTVPDGTDAGWKRDWIAYLVLGAPQDARSL